MIASRVGVLFHFSLFSEHHVWEYIPWSPKQDGPATRRSGASAIGDAKLQRFLLITQAFRVSSSPVVVYAKSCRGMLALVRGYVIKPQLQLLQQLLANCGNVRSSVTTISIFVLV
jgi:hypothetical protein